MRLKINLQRTKNDVLPINYQYEISAWIYKLIQASDPQFSKFLHKQGYFFEKKKFKLFTFSRLLLSGFRLLGDRLILLDDEISLVVSFFIDDALLHFIKGLFMEQQLILGDNVSHVGFTVKNVESLPDPDFNETAVFRCLSPITVGKPRDDNGKLRADYISPGHPNFKSLFFKNLIDKYLAATGDNAIPSNDSNSFSDNDLRFILLSQPRSRLVRIKANTPQETRVKGFEFDFELEAPVELLRFGYNAGFGEKNSLGFGCVEVQ